MLIINWYLLIYLYQIARISLRKIIEDEISLNSYWKIILTKIQNTEIFGIVYIIYVHYHE